MAGFDAVCLKGQVKPCSVKSSRLADQTPCPPWAYSLLSTLGQRSWGVPPPTCLTQPSPKATSPCHPQATGKLEKSFQQSVKNMVVWTVKERNWGQTGLLTISPRLNKSCHIPEFSVVTKTRSVHHRKTGNDPPKQKNAHGIPCDGAVKMTRVYNRCECSCSPFLKGRMQM